MVRVSGSRRPGNREEDDGARASTFEVEELGNRRVGTGPEGVEELGNRRVGISWCGNRAGKPVRLSGGSGRGTGKPVNPTEKGIARRGVSSDGR